LYYPNKYTFGTLSKDETKDRQAVLTPLVAIYQRDTNPIWEITQMFAKGLKYSYEICDPTRDPTKPGSLQERMKADRVFKEVVAKVTPHSLYLFVVL
jgi:hypothetical protein